MPASTQEKRKVYPQRRYWALIIPHHQFTPYLPTQCEWIRGQLVKEDKQINMICKRGRPRKSIEPIQYLDSEEEPQLINTNETYYLYWKVYVCFKGKARLKTVTNCFGRFYSKPVNSKHIPLIDTTYPNGIHETKFELGILPLLNTRSFGG